MQKKTKELLQFIKNQARFLNDVKSEFEVRITEEGETCIYQILENGEEYASWTLALEGQAEVHTQEVMEFHIGETVELLIQKLHREGKWGYTKW